MILQLPALIRVLTEKLNFRYWGPRRINRLDTYEIDLASWRLSFTDRTPCFWVHTPELLNLPAASLADEILDTMREQRWMNDPILVLVDGPATGLREQLAGLTPFLVINDKQQRQIVEAASPTAALLDIFLEQVKRSQLAPYETTRPVTGNRFFGRELELRRVLNHPDANYLVIGIRRIGKSSFLREIERMMESRDPSKAGKKRRVYVDCSLLTTPEEFFSEIIGSVSQQALKFYRGRSDQSRRFQSKMFDYLADQQGGPITYLIDEIDRLILTLKPDLSLFETLRRASQAKDAPARFILAGFKEAQRARNDLDAPFYHFAEEIVLKALDRHDVRDMIVGPMDRLRVRWEDREGIVQRIYRETAGMPNLIQYYCHALVQQSDLSERAASPLTAEDLRAIYEDASFREHVLQTFLSNSGPLERAIVFAALASGFAAPQKTFAQGEIEHALTVRDLNARFGNINDSFTTLVTANVLKQAGREYSFCIPLFPTMLMEHFDPEYGFKKAQEEWLVTEAGA